jgi:hypothetical protein
LAITFSFGKPKEEEEEEEEEEKEKPRGGTPSPTVNDIWPLAPIKCPL